MADKYQPPQRLAPIPTPRLGGGAWKFTRMTDSSASLARSAIEAPARDYAYDTAGIVFNWARAGTQSKVVHRVRNDERHAVCGQSAVMKKFWQRQPAILRPCERCERIVEADIAARDI